MSGSRERSTLVPPGIVWSPEGCGCGGLARGLRYDLVLLEAADVSWCRGPSRDGHICTVFEGLGRCAPQALGPIGATAP